MHHQLKNTCLLTDFYQFTMAQAYFQHGRENTSAVFHLFFRKNPFNGNWALIAGINDALDFVREFFVDDDSLAYLSQAKTSSGAPLFSEQFLSFLQKAKPVIDVRGVLDGDILFPFEPILRIEGPLYLCQLLETPILNIVNFQTLIATKAARIKLAARGKPVLEFGFRRAQGFDGAIAATKGAFIGGIDATSNVWAAKMFEIPLGGTQAHSFIMSYQHQIDAFYDFANTFPENCVLVVDTIDPIKGIDDAIKVFSQLKKQGHKPMGIRLDSGDLVYLSKAAKSAFGRAGLHECKIIASGDLDEYEIARLEEAFAPIDIYGVGTRLVTAHDDPALGGVYKLSAVQENGVWRSTFKPSIDTGKNSWPGTQSIIRHYRDGLMAFDHVIDTRIGKTPITKEDTSKAIELHQTLMKQGVLTKAKQRLAAMKERSRQSIESLPKALRSLTQTSPYQVYFDQALINMTMKSSNKGNIETNHESTSSN